MKLRKIQLFFRICRHKFDEAGKIGYSYRKDRRDPYAADLPPFLGYMEMEVKPGRVLISLKTTRFSA